MRKPLTREQRQRLHELRMEPNTEGGQNGITWFGVPGLFVQWRGNNQSFMFRWNERGKKRTMGLGSRKAVTDDEAYDLAHRYMAIVHQGGDPKAVRDQERAAAGLKPVRVVATASPTTMTFRDVVRAFLADRADSWKSEATELHFATQMRQHAYPVLADVPIQNIVIDHVVEVLKPIWRTHRPTAVKLRSRIGQVIDWAEAKGWRTGVGNPARSKAIITLLGNGKHRPKHFAAIHYSQLPAFWKRLAEVDGDVADALRLQLLTATRPSDATAAEWSEVDFENRVWTIPAERMKMGREHRVPLSTEALVILERRRAATAPDARFVFPGAKRSGADAPERPIGRQLLLKLIKSLGVNATAHGTARSSCREWASEVDGQGAEICEAILAHQEKSATVAAYQRSDMLGPRTAVMQRWSDFLTSVAEQPAR